MQAAFGRIKKQPAYGRETVFRVNVQAAFGAQGFQIGIKHDKMPLFPDRKTIPMTHFKKILLVSMVSAALNGCMALGVLGLGAVGASSIADRRSTGAQTDDQIMELRVKNNAMTAIKQANPQSNTTLSIISYNRKILLVGQADNENDKSENRNRYVLFKNMSKLWIY